MVQCGNIPYVSKPLSEGSFKLEMICIYYAKFNILS